ncbi:hypothetical protein EW145_g3365 [Phellinidium pouzarii]|uniref:Uncharacterized protein n=1 Tax=Phellinidium pouzarii TaxID=167371 RepID=A0A4S4LCP7_9AGAM|nr:hypothetical protein EW145_g3365 [Phellinidium pouzarii]
MGIFLDADEAQELDDTLVSFASVLSEITCFNSLEEYPMALVLNDSADISATIGFPDISSIAVSSILRAVVL